MGWMGGMMGGTLGIMMTLVAVWMMFFGGFNILMGPT